MSTMVLGWLATAAWAVPPPHLTPAAARQAFARQVCGEIARLADANRLPQDFLARLIWKESRFDPRAVSPVGAEGIAQFMPGTARLRGLADPFDHMPALAAAAAYLGSLRDRFGNLGLAAAAYNAGEDRAQAFRDEGSGLPFETQDYVLFITGHGHEEWRKPEADFAIPAIGKNGDFDDGCIALVLRQSQPSTPHVAQGDWKPWGVVLAGGFSEARAMRIFTRIRASHAGLIGDSAPLVMRKRNRSLGRALMVQVMIGRDSRDAAASLCRELSSAGAACTVAKNGTR